MRRSGAPRAEPTAAMPEATLDPRHGPLDPRKVLTSIGEVVYDWDLATDALAWGANAAEVLGVADRARLASGAGFALMVDPGGGETRHEAILRCEATDEGAGVPYRARYVLRHKGGRPSTIDDTGRWYAGPDGRPARAHGVLRIDRTAPAAVDDAGASARDRTEFLRRMRAEVAEAGRSRRPLTILVLASTRASRTSSASRPARRSQRRSRRASAASCGAATGSCAMPARALRSRFAPARRTRPRSPRRACGR